MGRAGTDPTAAEVGTAAPSPVTQPLLPFGEVGPGTALDPDRIEGIPLTTMSTTKKIAPVTTQIARFVIIERTPTPETPHPVPSDPADLPSPSVA